MKESAPLLPILFIKCWNYNWEYLNGGFQGLGQDTVCMASRWKEMENNETDC